MRKRRTAAAALIAAALLGTAQAFAAPAEEVPLYTDSAALTADVYVCDSENRTVILKNVTTDPKSQLAQEMRSALEYEIVPLTARTLYDSEGNLMGITNINECCLDGRVRVIAARSAEGIRIIYLQML